MASSRQDEEVQSTNDDAASSKFSAMKLGYWKDPYISFFSKPLSSFDRKPPELNRGYYARVKGVEHLLKQFLKKTDLKCQVINLGAGSDTTFWNLSDQNLAPLKWVELDFEPVVNKKIRIIRSKKLLISKLHTITCDGSSDSLPDVQIKPTEIHSNIYHIVTCDLRDISQFKSCIQKCSIDLNIPTIFICECVFIYVDPASSSQLVKCIAEIFKDAFFVNYEQVNMNDKFGEVMVSNLQARGCSLVGVTHCLNFQTHFDRFLKNGWNGVDGGDMLQIYHGLPQDDVQRVEKIEFLDDIEMLTQLFKHYCIIWAYKHSATSTTTLATTITTTTTTASNNDNVTSSINTTLAGCVNAEVAETKNVVSGLDDDLMQQTATNLWDFSDISLFCLK